MDLVVSMGVSRPLAAKIERIFKDEGGTIEDITRRVHIQYMKSCPNPSEEVVAKMEQRKCSECRKKIEAHDHLALKEGRQFHVCCCGEKPDAVFPGPSVRTASWKSRDGATKVRRFCARLGRL